MMGSTRQSLKVSKLLGTFLCGGDAERLFLVVVKVRRVAGALTLGNERSLHLKNNIITLIKLLNNFN